MRSRFIVGVIQEFLRIRRWVVIRIFAFQNLHNLVECNCLKGLVVVNAQSSMSDVKVLSMSIVPNIRLIAVDTVVKSIVHWTIVLIVVMRFAVS